MTEFTEKMIQAAREALDTPFHHQGRVAGVGLDCIGLIVHAACVAELPVDDCIDYGRNPDGTRLAAALLAHGFEEVTAMQGGDVLLFRFNRLPQHVALATSENSMIHAYAPLGRVVESGIGESWQRRLVGIYRYRAG